jgi:protein SCO1/2
MKKETIINTDEKIEKLNMKRVLLFLGTITVLAIFAMIALKVDQNIERSSSQNSAFIGGKFSLLNQNAQPITEKNLLGYHALIFFGYTYCPDVCPTVLQTVSVGLDLVDNGSTKIRPVFITIDPERDTPKVLKSYLENFHPLITGLTGTSEQVKKAAKAFGVYYAKAKGSKELQDNYLMDHSGGIYLMGPDGKFIKRFSHSVTPEEIAGKIKENF